MRVDNTRWLIDGQTNVDDVRDRLGIDIPDGEYVTLGGLLFERFGHIPAEGEEVRVGDWDLRVVEMDKRRVAQVVATFAGPGDGPPQRGRPAGDDGRGGRRRRPTGPGKPPAEAGVVWRAAPLGGRTGCGAAWLARCVRDAEVPGSNPGSPTRKSLFRAGMAPDARFAQNSFGASFGGSNQRQVVPERQCAVMLAKKVAAGAPDRGTEHTLGSQLLPPA